VGDLLCEREGGAALLRLNRPAARNAVNDEIMSALAEEVDRLAGDPDLRAVLLTGAGGEAFCAGGDLKWLETFETAEAGEAVTRRMRDILARLAALPVPVIAVLNGYALGGGAEVALACDLRVMEEHAFLSLRQARIGLMTGWGSGLEEGRRLAAEIARNAPLAIRAIKRFLAAAADLPLAEALELETALFRPLWTSGDHHEAIRAFIEKRGPVFKGS